MKNLSVLAIPIATPPNTPPPPGQVFVYFNTDGQLQMMGSDGMMEQLHLRKHSQNVTFTDSFDVLQVVDANNLVVEGDITERIAQDTVILIDGSTNGTNDVVRSIRSFSIDNGNTAIRLRRGRLDDALAENGALHLSREVNVEHMLESRSITTSLRNVVTGDSVDIADRIVDENNILLQPSTPTLGEFLLTVVA